MFESRVGCGCLGLAALVVFLIAAAMQQVDLSGMIPSGEKLDYLMESAPGCVGPIALVLIITFLTLVLRSRRQSDDDDGGGGRRDDPDPIDPPYPSGYNDIPLVTWEIDPPSRRDPVQEAFDSPPAPSSYSRFAAEDDLREIGEQTRRYYESQYGNQYPPQLPTQWPDVPADYSGVPEANENDINVTLSPDEWDTWFGNE